MPKIVFFGFDDPLGLSAVQPHLESMRRYVPSDLSFVFVPQDVTAEDLVSRVDAAIADGAAYVGLPEKSELVGAFLSVARPGARWPSVVFLAQFANLSTLNHPNVYVFNDIHTPMDPSLIRHNLTRLVKGTGTVYVMWQGDALTRQMVDVAIQALADYDVTVRLHEIGGEHTIDESRLAQAVDDVSLSLPPSPAQSVVFHLVNRLQADEYTTKAAGAGLFSLSHDRLVHSSFMNEYRPVNVPLPVRLSLDYQPLIGFPSSQAAAAGVPLDPQQYYAVPYAKSYFDAYVWAATQGYTDGVNDKQLRFDDRNTRICFFVADESIPANALSIAVRGIRFNPRWWDPDAPVF